MKNNKHPLAVPLVVCALFSACGGGGSSAPDSMAVGAVAPSPPPPPPAPAPPTPAPAPAETPAPAPAASQVVIANASASAQSVTQLADGSQVAVWSESSGVFAQRFNNAGAAGDRVQLATTGKVDGVAALVNGGYAVEYETSDAVFVQVVNTSGSALAAPVTLVTAAQLAATPTGYPTEGYALVAGTGVLPAPDGSFLAGYVRSHPVHVPGDTAYGLVVQRYDAAGHSLGDAKVASNGYFVANMSETALPNGGFAFAYDGRYLITQVTVYDAALDLQGYYGAPMFVGNQGLMRVAGLDNGQVVAIWSDTSAHQVKGQVFHPDPNGGTVAVNDSDVLVFAGVQEGAHILSLPGHRFLLTWGGNQAQVFDASGQPVSQAITIASENVAVVSSTQIVALAQEGSQLVAHHYAI